MALGAYTSASVIYVLVASSRLGQIRVIEWQEILATSRVRVLGISPMSGPDISLNKRDFTRHFAINEGMEHAKFYLNKQEINRDN